MVLFLKILIFISYCFSSSGCVQVTETYPTELPEYQRHQTFLKEGDALQHFQRGNSNLETIRASGTMMITDDQNGFIQETSIILLANNKNQVFLRGYQALSPNLFTFWINYPDFLYYLPQEDIALKGSIKNYDKNNYDLLFPPEIMHLLFFPFSMKAYPLIETKESRQEKVSHFTYDYPSNDSISKIEVVFDHKNLFPQKIYFFDQQGILKTKIDYSQINMSGKIQYPKKMDITWPHKTKSISLKLKKMLFNSKLSSQIFQGNIPSEVQIKNLNE